MSRNPSLKEQEMAAKVLAQSRLVAKNKELARAHLLQIQLILARRPIQGK